MKNRISFGKVDGYKSGKNNCEVVLDFGFQEFHGQAPYFSVIGYLYNHLHTDCIMGGQCIDGLAELFPRLGNNAKYLEIMNLWKSYHLKPIDQIPENVVKRINEIVEKGV